MRQTSAALFGREDLLRFASRAPMYASALGLLAVALFVRWLLDPWLAEAQPLSLLFGAVALAVWRGGIGPAVLVSLAGYVASDYLFIAPRGVLAIATPGQLIALLTYLVSCAIIIVFAEGMRRANRRAAEYADSLERQHRALEAAERRKDEFLATLAHELRHPLGPIRNAAHLLALQPDPPAPVRRALGIIERQVRHMMRLIEDLLDLARVREGRIHLQRERIDVAAAIDAAVELARPLIAEAGHTLELAVPAETLTVQGDPTRLSQIFSNLLSNAARYTPRGGRIRLEARREGAAAVLAVRDTGIGIPPDELERIFELFAQLERGAEQRHGGLGIGLALVRRLVELHEGSITAHSAGAGRGSEFVVRLPLASAVPAGGCGHAAERALQSRASSAICR